MRRVRGRKIWVGENVHDAIFFASRAARAISNLPHTPRCPLSELGVAWVLMSEEHSLMRRPLSDGMDAARSQRVLRLDDHVHGVRVEAGRLNGNLARLARARAA